MIRRSCMDRWDSINGCMAGVRGTVWMGELEGVIWTLGLWGLWGLRGLREPCDVNGTARVVEASFLIIPWP